MQNNKSPGSDGITTEFYKIFWSDIKSYYVKSLNYSFENGDMTVMQKQGLISLLPKKNNDLGNLNNWRPLTLLNTDYKIVTKTISNRIKKYVSHHRKFTNWFHKGKIYWREYSTHTGNNRSTGRRKSSRVNTLRRLRKGFRQY